MGGKWKCPVCGSGDFEIKVLCEDEATMSVEVQGPNDIETELYYDEVIGETHYAEVFYCCRCGSRFFVETLEQVPKDYVSKPIHTGGRLRVMLSELTAAAKEVIDCWEKGSLACAVRNLDAVLKETEE